MSVATSQLTKSAVTLKGSAQIVAEFFNYGINSILYQRGIYPPGAKKEWNARRFDLFYNIFVVSESFTRKQEYGLTMLVSTDDKVTTFLKEILAQVQVRVQHGDEMGSVG
jgi:mitotic spindle assembly checkpoint protein MAD2